MVDQRGSGPPGAAYELAVAVGAHHAQDVTGARAAPGALEGADPDVVVIDGEVAVAALAIGAELQHASTLVRPRPVGSTSSSSGR